MFFFGNGHYKFVVKIEAVAAKIFMLLNCKLSCEYQNGSYIYHMPLITKQLYKAKPRKTECKFVALLQTYYSRVPTACSHDEIFPADILMHSIYRLQIMREHLINYIHTIICEEKCIFTETINCSGSCPISSEMRQRKYFGKKYTMALVSLHSLYCIAKSERLIK